jgi:hypothetical protein
MSASIQPDERDPEGMTDRKLYLKSAASNYGTGVIMSNVSGRPQAVGHLQGSRR